MNFNPIIVQLKPLSPFPSGTITDIFQSYNSSIKTGPQGPAGLNGTDFQSYNSSIKTIEQTDIIFGLISFNPIIVRFLRFSMPCMTSSGCPFQSYSSPIKSPQKVD